MKKKLFISISPPEEVKKNLFLLKDNLSDLPAKWIKEENIHITLLFIGYINDNKINELKLSIRRVVEKVKAFEIKIKDISYAPPNLNPPKMIWANIIKSDSLDYLRKRFHEEVGVGSREFLPHITLAKINSWQFNKMEPEEIPKIEREGMTFTTKSVELMESKVLKGSVKYELLEKFKLNEK